MAATVMSCFSGLAAAARVTLPGALVQPTRKMMMAAMMGAARKFQVLIVSPPSTCRPNRARMSRPPVAPGMCV